MKEKIYRTKEDKEKIAKQGILARDNDGNIKDLSKMLGINYTMLTRWIREFEEGKFEKKIEEPKLDPYIEQIRLLKKVCKKMDKIIDLLDPPLPPDLMKTVSDELNLSEEDK